MIQTGDTDMKLATILGVGSAITYSVIGVMFLIMKIHWTGGWEILSFTRMMVVIGAIYIMIQGIQALTSSVTKMSQAIWDIFTSIIPLVIAGIAIGVAFPSNINAWWDWWLYTIPVMVDMIFLVVVLIKLRLSSDFSQSS